jgi:K+ transporter
VINPFPSGGRYRAATVLIGLVAELVSGSALIVDHLLTITISVASALETLSSLYPVSAHTKVTV